MNPILTITKRELASFFDSLIAYIMLVIFLGFCGFFTWMFGSDIFMRGQADLYVFFSWAYLLLFLFIPALTMRLLAEEKRVGTIELLLTKAVSDRQLVIGKFLSCWLLIIIALAFTLPYYFTVATLGNIDHGAIWCGYLGLILMSAAHIAIGLFASSITNNQIVAFLLALVIGGLFQYIFGFVSGAMPGFLGEVLNYLDFNSHFSSMARGVIDTKDVVYFLSVTALGLLLTEVSIGRLRA